MTNIKYPYTSIQRMKSARKSPKMVLSLLVATGLAGSSYLLNAQQMQQQQQPQQQEQSQDDVQERLQRLQVKLQSLNAEIQEVQSEANNNPEVRDALKKYSAELTKQMKEIDPEKSDLIDERNEVYAQLLELSSNEDMSEQENQELQSLGERFNAIRQELSMVEAQANQTEPVQEAFKNYNDKIMAVMSEIDSGITEKIEEQQELTQEFSQLRNAIQQQQQQ